MESVDHTTAGTIQIWEVYDATWGHGVIQDQAAVEGHVQVCGPTVARVWIDICGAGCN